LKTDLDKSPWALLGFRTENFPKTFFSGEEGTMTQSHGDKDANKHQVPEKSEILRKEGTRVSISLNIEVVLPKRHALGASYLLEAVEALTHTTNKNTEYGWQ